MDKKITKGLKINGNTESNSEKRDHQNIADITFGNSSGRESHLKQVIKEFGIIGISKTLLSVSGIILLPFLTKFLGDNDYGLWVQVGAATAILTPIMEMGLSDSIVRIFPSKVNIKEIGKDFSSITFLLLLVAVSVSTTIFLYPSILANAIFEGNVVIVKILAILLFTMTLDDLFMTVFRVFREMKTYAIFEISTRYAEISLAIYVVIKGYGLIYVLMVSVFVRVIMIILLGILVSRKLKPTIPNILKTKEYLHYGIPLIPTNLSQWVISASDRLIIGLLLGSTFVAYYTPGYMLGMEIPAMIASIIVFVLTPAFSEYYEKGNMSTIYLITNFCLKYFLILSALYLVGSILFGKKILEILTTTTIAENGSLILIFTAVTGLFWGVYIIFARYMILKMRTRLFAIYWIFAGITNVVGNIILIPIVGIIGAAITTIISYFIIFILILNFAFKNFKIQIELDYIPKLVISTIITGLSIIILRDFVMITNIALDILLALFIYTISVFLLRIIKKEEIILLKSLFKN